MKKKQQKEPADESFEMTFIALMLLLFCFMVIMVSLAQLEGPRFRRAIGSVRGALAMLSQAPGESMVAVGGPGVLPEAGGIGEYDSELTKRRERAGALESSLGDMLDEDLKGMVRVEVTDEGFAFTLGSLILYDRARANLKPEAAPILDELSDFLGDWAGRVTVIGHTCDLPIHTAMYPSNWDLSIARAVEVVRYMERGGFEGGRLLAVGRGEACPVVPNESEEQRAFNRRVEILLDYEDVSPEPEVSSPSESETASLALGYDTPRASAETGRIGGSERGGG